MTAVDRLSHSLLLTLLLTALHESDVLRDGRGAVRCPAGLPSVEGREALSYRGSATTRRARRVGRSGSVGMRHGRCARERERPRSAHIGAMPQAGIRAHSGTVQRLVGPQSIWARFDSTAKVRTKAQVGRRGTQAAAFLCALSATVRACTPPDIERDGTATTPSLSAGSRPSSSRRSGAATDRTICARPRLASRPLPGIRSRQARVGVVRPECADRPRAPGGLASGVAKTIN